MGRRAIVLLVALVLAGLAAWAVWNFLQNYQSDAEAGQEQVTVFRAGANGIAEGTEGAIVLSNLGGADAQVSEGTDELEDVPSDAIQTEEELRQVLTGSLAAGPISGNAILTRSQWTSISVEVVPLSEQIASGNQAITISTSNIQGINGFVEAGDRINMIITLDIEFDLIPLEGTPTLPQPEPPTTDGTTPTEEVVTVTYTRYVLQGLNVLAAGRDVRLEEDGDQTGEVPATDTGTGTGTGDGTTTDTVPPAEGEDQGNSTVFTLEVTPDQAERIVYAFENGSIWLTLVPEDFVEIETDGVTIDNLFGG
ncbi:MAG TPA: RcpC/CpaB family pilus assembly protein, partial [Acidimicrobiia bacterium]|nr:RcpC/CpaB family pilus assembly protein [Acidimicrobiia bacterium]